MSPHPHLRPARRRSAAGQAGRAVLSAALVAAVILGVVPARPAAAAEDPAGSLTIVKEGGTGRLESGGSATRFTLRLPDGAACPGDTADGDYLVQTYMVPAEIDPANVTYNGLGPTPESYGEYATFREPLYDVATHPFVSMGTARAERPGGPGAIVNLPTFSFAVYGPGELPAGRYNVGVACTLANQVVRSWGRQLVMAKAGDDTPAQITWSLDVEATGGSGSGATTAVLVLLPVLGLAVILSRRARRSPSTTMSEAR